MSDDVTAPDDWDRHWVDYADSASDNPAQLYRRSLVRSLLGAGPSDRILDIGSGQGDLAADLLAAVPGAAVLGLELSSSGVAYARRHVPGARFEQADLLRAGAPPDDLAGWATVATCCEVLEHVDDPAALLRGAVPYLAPGARLVVTVPGGPRTAFDRHIGHRRHYRRADIATVLEQAGFEVERTMAAGFPFFNLYRLVVLARGKRLIDDVRTTEPGATSAPVRAVLATFRVLFHANVRSSPFGWQIVAVARLPRVPRPGGLRG